LGYSNGAFLVTSMEIYSLQAQTRTEIGGRRVNRVRAQGLIPAVVYGHGVEPTHLTVEGNNFVKLYRAAGESSLVDLSVADGASVKVLIQEVQMDPVRDEIRHIDFRQVRMDEKLETEIELEFTGEAPAVKAHGGILVKNMDAFSVRCLPGALVHEIQVSLEVLKNFSDRITVADVKVPEGIEVLHEPTQAVVLVEEPRSEEEMKALDSEVEGDVSGVEVTTEKKEDEDEGEGAADAKKDEGKDAAAEKKE
jgi:large subunit ribosomal protein L25